MVNIRAIFDDYGPFVDALRTLKGSGVKDYEAYGPIDLAEIEDLMPRRGSSVRAWATAGALFGLASFWFMCVASSLIYSLVTGGKPPVSNVPFIIVSYEGTILLGAISAFIAVLIVARLRSKRPPPVYDKIFSGDCFGIVVRCDPEERERVANLLTKSGAIEINELE